MTDRKKKHVSVTIAIKLFFFIVLYEHNVQVYVLKISLN